MKYLKVKDKENFIRDLNSNGILSTDVEGYELYVQKYKEVYNEKMRLNELENDVNSIKNDLNEIKTLLRNLVNGS